MPEKYDLPITQRSTMAAMVAAVLVAVSLTYSVDQGEASVTGNLLKLVHLGTFSAWFGTQIWVSFVAGLTMYRNLPRHTFGYIQGKLFPKYFLLGTILSSLVLASFLVLNPYSSWQRQQIIQCFILIAILMTSTANMLYFEPQTTKCTMIRHKYEKEVSAGQSVGKLEEDKLTQLRKISEYAALEKRFIFLHTCGTVTNLISLAMHVVHLYYLSANLRNV